MDSLLCSNGRWAFAASCAGFPRRSFVACGSFVAPQSSQRAATAHLPAPSQPACGGRLAAQSGWYAAVGRLAGGLLAVVARVGAGLGGEHAELVGHRPARGALGADQQHGVVAGDRAGQAGQAGPVEGGGEHVGVAGRGAHHHQVPARDDRRQRQRQDLAQLPFVDAVGGQRLGQGVDEAAVVAADLDRAELVEVARDGGLGGLEALGVQRLEQAGLAGDAAAAQQRGKRRLPGQLQRGHGATSARAPASLVTAWSTSASLTTSGGASRTAVSVTGLTTRPRSSASAATSLALARASGPSSRANHSPRPRTPACGPIRAASSTRPSLRCSETLATWPSSSRSTTSRVARAAAQATGPPPMVEAWSPGRMVLAISAVSVVAPTAAAKASASPKGTWLKPAGSSAKVGCSAGLPVAARVARVRPWKPPSAATIPTARSPLVALAQRLPTLMAASLASAPELEKNTLAGGPKRSTSRSARSTCGPVK